MRFELVFGYESHFTFYLSFRVSKSQENASRSRTILKNTVINVELPEESLGESLANFIAEIGSRPRLNSNDPQVSL
ncbi:hypothetical protein LEP1GSC194_3026 [Leptospira alstonii serovar Sichuan str. 79601]|uniref:Uncharacterized protein n=1 Tax=Leptospira alstonii serovar Sichuan str. 79601 TaxID=1218565 RepID=M6DGI0_9LEPT|nr:hypothetical protein LEP1GSC194_3026 [Leptospira alstonii serovar Sichuan str. 79601]